MRPLSQAAALRREIDLLWRAAFPCGGTKSLVDALPPPEDLLLALRQVRAVVEYLQRRSVVASAVEELIVDAFERRGL